MEKFLKGIVVFLLLVVVGLAFWVGRLSAEKSEPQPSPSSPVSDSASSSQESSADETSGQDSQTSSVEEIGGEVSENNIIGLQCSVTHGALEIIPGKEFQVSDSTNGQFEASVKDGIYVVTGSNTMDNHITVTVPENFVFQNVSLSANGGALNAQGLQTGNLQTSCDGGSINFTGSISKDASVEHLLGKTVLQLTGKPTDYNYALSYSMGHIGIGDQQYAGTNGSQSIDNGSGQNMQIHCKMGSVSVVFP